MGMGMSTGPAILGSPAGPSVGDSDTYAFWQVSDLSTLFEERTGASATTPSSVDGVVGTVLDKGNAGAHIVATADGNRGVLRQSGSYYYIEQDGVDDYYVTQSSIATLGIMTASAFEVFTAETMRSAGDNIGPYTYPYTYHTSNGGFLLLLGRHTNTTPDGLACVAFDGGVKTLSANETDIGSPEVMHARLDSGNLVHLLVGSTERTLACGNITNLAGNLDVNRHGGSGSVTSPVNWYGGLVVGANLTAGQRAANYTYFGNLMGLEL